MAEPLRQMLGDSLYKRPPEIEALIDVLAKLPKRELVVRAKIKDKTDNQYVPTECILYFIRQTRGNDKAEELLGLFEEIRKRIQRVNLDSSNSATSIAIEEELLDSFTVLIARDRKEYLKRLDSFECRFNKALSNLRKDAMRKVLGEKEEPPEDYPSFDTDDSLSAEANEAFSRWKDENNRDKPDFLYLKKLGAAINQLPPDYRRVIDMLFLEESAEAETLAQIGKVLGCSLETVQYRRDKAIAMLHKLLGEKE